MNNTNQELLTRINRLTAVCAREKLEHVSISTNDLIALFELYLDNEHNSYKENEILQAKLDAANQDNDNRLASMKNLYAELSQARQNVDVLLAKLAELGETVFVQQFGRGLRMNVSTFPDEPVLVSEDDKAKIKKTIQAMQPKNIDNVQSSRFGVAMFQSYYAVHDFKLQKDLPFEFDSNSKAKDFADILNSFITK